MFSFLLHIKITFSELLTSLRELFLFAFIMFVLVFDLLTLQQEANQQTDEARTAKC